LNKKRILTPQVTLTLASNKVQCFVHYCLDVSRDDEMAGQAFEQCCGCPWVEIFLRSVGKKTRWLITVIQKSKIQPSMANMARQIILSKPLFITVWMYQEMMRWHLAGF
jgi:hypothetical protein